MEVLTDEDTTHCRFDGIRAHDEFLGRSASLTVWMMGIIAARLSIHRVTILCQIHDALHAEFCLLGEAIHIRGEISRERHVIGSE